MNIRERFCMRLWLGLCGVGLVCAVSVAAPGFTDVPEPPKIENPFEAIDKHALETPAESERTLEGLSKHLIEPAKSDRDKARAIYRWLTDRIHYDVDAFFTDYHGALRPEDVLRERKAVCHGFASLYEDLARRAGLEAFTIRGYAKGVQSLPDEGWPRANHAWNAVKIDGRWELLDTTRGSGFLKGQRYRKVFQEQYFLTPPHRFVLTHYPADPNWQLLAHPVTWQQFNGFSDSKAVYLNAGVDSETSMLDPKNPGIHHSTRPYLHYGALRILFAPMHGTLPPGHTYSFVVDASQARHVALKNNDEFVYLKKTGTRFEGSIRVEPGPLHLLMQPYRQDGSFQAVLTYTIESYPSEENEKKKKGLFSLPIPGTVAK